MNVDDLNLWFPEVRQSAIIERLISSQDVGLPDAIPPLKALVPPKQFINCTHGEAHELFYSDQERGSERAAGSMLKTLSDLGFIKSRFTGNTTQILINPIPQLLDDFQEPLKVTLELDYFEPRGDAVPLSSLLADNYNWMNRNNRSIPRRICDLLRQWATQYKTGMRVLRRTDNQNPVGLYLLFPITKKSESVLQGPPNEGLHLGSLNETDPFEMARPGDKTCTSLFVRSWMIDEAYRHDYTVLFLEDVQTTLGKMQTDFPNLCDLWTLIIHPRYHKLATRVGFQRYNQKTKNMPYWMYQSFDRFMNVDMKAEMKDFSS